MVGLLIAAWTLLAVVLPAIAVARVARAVRALEAVRRDVERLASQVRVLEQHLAAGRAAAGPGAAEPAPAAPGEGIEIAPPAAGFAAASPPGTSLPGPGLIEATGAAAGSVRPGSVRPGSSEAGAVGLGAAAPGAAGRDAAAVGAGAASVEASFEGAGGAGLPGAHAPPAAAAGTGAPAAPGGEHRTRDQRTASARTAASLESRIGGRWFLYAAIATLVLGTSYFIKYAFENDWVTPPLRVALGALGGAALVEGGRRFAARGLGFFGQVLTGGGIAILYLSVYAAYDFYGLVGRASAFSLLVAVTATAAWRADAARSQSLALVAVLGGFATPFLVGGEADAQATLFAYDALLVCGTLVLARRHGWPALNLASWALTGLTIAAWAGVHYAPSKWLRTELWLTLFCALFLAIRHYTRDTASAWTRPAGLLLATTPVPYHAASLAILWRHTAGLLVYFIGATVWGIVASVHPRRPWLRLAAWVAVAGPALGWFAGRPARWDVAALAALAAIYSLHLVTEARELDERPGGPGAVDILLLHGNGLWAWGGLALLLEEVALAWLGAVTALLALWNGALAAALRARHREAALHHLALAFALLAAAAAIEFDGAPVTAAWAAEGAALVWLGLAAGRQWLRGAGAVLLALALVRLASDLLAPGSTAWWPIANPRTLTALLAAGLLLLLAWRHGRAAGASRYARDIAALVVGAATLGLLVLSAEIDLAFARRAWAGLEAAGAGAVTSAGLALHVTLSTAWAAYALGLVAVGIHRRYAPLRYLAIAIFAGTVVKVFAVDLARLDRFYRILSTIGLGLLLLVASYLYQRFASRPDPDAGPGTP
jgi:uncharacterized membrane protein